MRLFRRRDEAAEAATPDPTGPATGASADSGADDGVAREPKQPTGDWMTLPPMAPTFRSMPTTFRVQTLPEILPSHHDTRLSGSLGHAVSSDAPSGSIGGLTSRPGDGLTHSGDVSRSSGAGSGDLLLREPHHESAPEAPAIEVRRLADPAPISTSSSSPMAAPSLPAPTVSRSLLDTAPLVARPSSERPLPVARVVDAPAAASATAAPATPSAPPSLSSEPAPADDAPFAGDDDDRVGGFGVGSDDLDGFGGLAAPVDDVPRIAAPPELAPPIQPRRIQRSLDGAAPTAAPLVGDGAPGTSVDPLVPPTPATTPGGGALPLVSRAPAAPSGDLPISRLADASPSSSATAASGGGTATDGAAGTSSTSTPTASAPTTSTPTASSPSPTTNTSTTTTTSTTGSDAAPSSPSSSSTGSGDAAESPFDVTVSRLADGTTAPLSGGRPLTGGPDVEATSPGDAETAPRGELPLFRPAPAGADAVEPPIQRLADTSAPSASTPPGPTGGASLLGDAPLATAAADAVDTGDDDPSDAAAPPSAGELPLVHPPRGNDDTDSSTAGPTFAAPTLGADAEPMVSVQPLADTAGAPSPNPSPGTAGLPLAPSDLGPALTPPHRPAPDEVQRLPEASATSAATRPLVSPTPTSRAASTAPSLQRLDSPSHAPASTATLPFVRPIGAASSGLGVQRAIAGTAPMSSQSPTAPAGSPSSSDLPVQLRRLGAPDVADGVTTAASLSTPSAASTGAGPLPLAAVQRLDASTGSASAGLAPTGPTGTTGAAELPLHTPAAAIPSAADIAVRAGLAERGPDGSLFTASAPASSSFTIQRELDGGSDVADGGSGNEIAVQRAVTIGGHRAAAAASRPQAASAAAPSAPLGGSDDDDNGSDKDSVADSKSLAAEAKKLYPFIRSALEADMRRQLEGKSRASRYRP